MNEWEHPFDYGKFGTYERVNDSGVATSREFTIPPIKIGMVQDWGIGTKPVHEQYDATFLAFEEAYDRGLIPAPVEIHLREVDTQPFGSYHDAEQAWLELADMGCLAIIGPHTSQNTPTLSKVIDRRRVPTIVQSESIKPTSEYTFVLPNGTFPDEAFYMARTLTHKGASTVGVIHERNALGDEYWEYFSHFAPRIGLEIVVDRTLPGVFDQELARTELARIRAAKVDSIAYMGDGHRGAELFKAARDLEAEGWLPHRVMSTMFLGTIDGLGHGFSLEQFEGWAGVDQYDERNPVFTDLLDRYEKRFGVRPVHCYVAQGYDLGNVLAEALATVGTFTPEAVHDALERVRMLPAATGGPGNVIGFGPHDHRGYKGQYVVMREIKDGSNVPVFPPVFTG